MQLFPPQCLHYRTSQYRSCIGHHETLFTTLSGRLSDSSCCPSAGCLSARQTLTHWHYSGTMGDCHPYTLLVCLPLVANRLAASTLIIAYNSKGKRHHRRVDRRLQSSSSPGRQNDERRKSQHRNGRHHSVKRLRWLDSSR
jgi:hypothetical protein